MIRRSIPFVLWVALLGPAVAEDAESTAVPSAGRLLECNPGPWGRLEYYYTYLEAPESLMAPIPTPSAITVWHLPGLTREEQAALLLESGLAQEQVDLILENSVLSEELDATTELYPPVEVLLDIPPEIRARIARLLGRFPRNQFHRGPLVIDSGNVREWFSGSSLTPETISLIEQLSYPLGEAVAFSDVPLVLELMREGERMEREFLRALTRTRSLVLRLRVDSGSDFEEIGSYWTAGYKNKDIQPLLESVARSEGIGHLDVIHLLPPTPRQYLYTFPSLSDGLSGMFPDSFWTALNFFEYIPRDEFKDFREMSRYAEESYGSADTPLQFGDLLVVFDPNAEKAIQAATYIADDIVYTKSGRSVYRPYVLTRLQDLVNRYRGEFEFEIRAWRKVEN